MASRCLNVWIFSSSQFRFEFLNRRTGWSFAFLLYTLFIPSLRIYGIKSNGNETAHLVIRFRRKKHLKAHKNAYFSVKEYQVRYTKYSCKHFVLFAYQMYCTVRTKYLYNNKTLRIGNKPNCNVQSKQGPRVIPQILYDDRRRRALLPDNGHSHRFIGTRPPHHCRHNLGLFISVIYIYIFLLSFIFWPAPSPYFDRWWDNTRPEDSTVFFDFPFSLSKRDVA